MRSVRLASLLIAAVVLNTACEKTGDTPGGKGDTLAPYGGANAAEHGSIGSTPGYMNAAPGATKPVTYPSAAPNPTPPLTVPDTAARR